jgi:hypothetical protein
VPTAVPGLVRWGSSPDSVCVFAAALSRAEPDDVIVFASPKSKIFAWPRTVTKIFAGLTSR